MRLIIAFAFAASLSAADKNWVGSQSCAACHARIFQSFSRTPMAATSGLTANGLTLERFNQASFAGKSWLYRVTRGAGTLALDIQGTAAGIELRKRRRLDYFIGSGAAARSYLISVDGFLYEAPAAYYSGPGKWDLPPGYGRYPYPYLTRAIAPGCLECHASGIRIIPGTQNGYATPPFLEGGVGCERCHGPGSAHVAKMKAGSAGGRADIVNPASLDPETRDAVCAQCHLSGEIRVVRAGRESQTFVAGERLSAYRTVFVRAGDSSRQRVTSHVENLAQSACKRASGARMWCGTCHDAHSVPAPTGKAAWYRARCLTCHAVEDCGEATRARRANRDDCIACHMPRNPVTDAEHVVYTDHSIRRRPALPETARPMAEATLVAFGGERVDARDLGLAYAIAGDRERAFELLKAAVDQGANDAEALSYLAELYKNRQDDRSAVLLYERALHLDPNQTGALAALGAYRVQAHDDDEAIRLWKAALERSPALVLVRVNLAEALVRKGHVDEAEATLKKALEFNPAFAAARKLLSGIHAQRPGAK